MNLSPRQKREEDNRNEGASSESDCSEPKRAVNIQRKDTNATQIGA